MHTRVCAVHPHPCGEHARTNPSRASLSGPSPPVWGTRDGVPGLNAEHRSIPTRVGNTPGRGPAARGGPVHPHPCGEHVTSSPPVTYRCGPSPPVWGTRSIWDTKAARYRSIPTRVGNTPRFLARAVRRAVHPHPCGEHSLLERDLDLSVGPSPPVWGTHLMAGGSIFVWRSIPTRVGNTSRGVARSPAHPVHPHPCGEHVGAPVREGDTVGPSPPVWGTHFGITLSRGGPSPSSLQRGA